MFSNVDSKRIAPLISYKWFYELARAPRETCTRRAREFPNTTQSP